jgi:hypothetical protein
MPDCVGVTVRTLLRERYGYGGATDAGGRRDRSELRRFRLWLTDARRRVRRLRADKKCRALLRRVQAWRDETSGRMIQKMRL